MERATKSKEEKRRLEIKRLATAERLKKQEIQIEKDLEAMRNPVPEPVAEPVPSVPKPTVPPARFSNMKPGHLERVAQHRYNSARSAHKSMRRSNRSNASASATLKHHSLHAAREHNSKRFAKNLALFNGEPVEPEAVEAVEPVSSQLSHVGIFKRIHNNLKTTACAYLPGEKRDWCVKHETEMEKRRRRESAHKKKGKLHHSKNKLDMAPPISPHSHKNNPLIHAAPPVKEEKVYTHNPFNRMAKNSLIDLSPLSTPE